MLRLWDVRVDAEGVSYSVLVEAPDGDTARSEAVGIVAADSATAARAVSAVEHPRSRAKQRPSRALTDDSAG